MFGSRPKYARNVGTGTGTGGNATNGKGIAGAGVAGNGVNGATGTDGATGGVAKNDN